MLPSVLSSRQVRLLVVIGFLIWLSTPKCFSQSQHDAYDNAVKVNINYRKTFGENDMSFGQLAPVFIKANKRNNYHELELNTLNAKTYETVTYAGNGIQPYNEEIKTFDFGLRYQFTLNIKKEGKLIPQLGLSFLSLYNRTKADPLTSNSYYRRSESFRQVISIAPQVKFNCGKRTFIDLAVPLDVFDITSVYMKINNPAIPIRQQRNSHLDASFNEEVFERLHLRLGVGVRF
jgi:hypothetical protein